VTFDRDFGALVAMGPTAVPGVLLLRLPPRSAVVVTTLLVNLLARTEVTWLGHLSVVTEGLIRQRKLVRAVSRICVLDLRLSARPAPFLGDPFRQIHLHEALVRHILLVGQPLQVGE
jgi:hypothetical protein